MNRKKIIVIILSIALVIILFFAFQYIRNRQILNLISKLKSNNSETVKSAETELALIGSPAVSPLLYALQYDSDRFRLGASRTLGKMGDGKFAEGAVLTYEKRTESFRIRIIGILGKIGDWRAVDPLIKILSSKEEDEIKLEAVDSLGLLGDTKACKPIIDCLVDMNPHEPNTFLPDLRRKVFVRSLKRLGNSSIEYFLFLIGKSDERTRIVLQWVMWGTLSRDSLEILLKHYEDENPFIRATVLTSLRQLKTSSGDDDEKIFLLFIKSLKDKNMLVRTEAAQGLRGVKDKRKIQPLIDCLCATSHENDAGFCAMLALEEPGDEASIPGLIPCLKNSNPEVRKAAFRILAKVMRDKRKLEDLAIGLLQDKDMEIQADALNELNKVGTEKAVDPISSLILANRDDVSYLNENAISAIAGIEGEKSYRTLVKLLNSPDKRIRNGVIESLAYRGKDRSADLLLNQTNSKETWLRCRAIWALRFMRNRKYRCKFEELLKDKAEEVRIASLEALGFIADPASFNAITPLLRDQGGKVRIAAIKALLEMKGKGDNAELSQTLRNGTSKSPGENDDITARLHNEDMLKIFMEIIKDGDNHFIESVAEGLFPNPHDKYPTDKIKAMYLKGDDKTKRCAAIFLGYMGGNEEKKFLEQVYPHESRIVRQAIIAALGEAGNESSVPLLIDALKDKMLINNAVYALQEIGDERASIPLAECLKTCDISMKRDVISAILIIHEEKSAVPMIEILKSEENFQVRRSIAQLVGIIGGNSTVNQLLKMLESEDPYERDLSIIALGETKDRRAFEPILNLLQNDGSMFAGDCIYALGKLKDERGIDILIDLLNSREAETRDAAINALGEMGDKRAAEPLMSLLKHAEISRKAGLIEALGEIKDKRSVGIIINSLKDEDNRIREEAAKALREIGDPTAVIALAEALKDNDENVRREAAKSLYLLGDGRGRDYLIQLLENSDVSGSSFIKITLMEAGNGRDMLLMADCLKSRNDRLRLKALEALEALEKVKTPESDRLIRKMLNDRNIMVRRKAEELSAR